MTEMPATTPSATSSIASQLMAAVGNGTLLQRVEEFKNGETVELSGPDWELVDRVDRALLSIGSLSRSAAKQAHERLLEINIASTVVPVNDWASVPTTTLTLTKRQHLPAAARAMQGLGYQFDGEPCDAAWRAYSETYPEAVFLAPGDVLRVVLTWPRPRAAGLVWKFRPSMDDLAVSLPVAAWPAYGALKIGRLVNDRLRRRHRAPALGPYLATPLALIQPVLDLASPQSGELVVDLGCGDGRVLIDAAKRHGSRGRGIEYLPELADRARRNVEAAGLRPDSDRDRRCI
jgi:hypothetical protein